MEGSLNYYPFHIGDYASATRHLTWDEDAAYRRLLDVYYTLEKAIPANKAYRLAVAVSKVQRDAVDTVLSEFFVKTPEGWRHERCEDELDAMRVKQAAQEAKDAHESERMRRYRERRAEMFSALRAVQVFTAWDLPMKDLQRLFDTHCNKPETPNAMHLQREQAVSGETPATAIYTNTNTNTSIKERERAPSGTRLPADWTLPDEWAAWALQERPDLIPSQTAQCFADYWHGVAGAKGRKADWLATWRNWVRGEKTQPARHPQALSFAERDELAKRKRWEEMTGRKWPTNGQTPEFTDINTINQLTLDAS
jgi:uncharacterized protein YdaU (DUF1376 family)